MNDEAEASPLAHMGTDAARWAAEFRATAMRLGYSRMDEGWLIGWFANAIGAGEQIGERRERKRHEPTLKDRSPTHAELAEGAGLSAETAKRLDLQDAVRHALAKGSFLAAVTLIQSMIDEAVAAGPRRT